MDIDDRRLAEQIKLAYEFIETLHGQAIALIKDVEAQLVQASGLQLLRPGGYRYTVNPTSYSLERPQVSIADYFAVYFRYFEGRVRNTPLDGDVPPIGFLKIVFRERGLAHPEVRFGVLTDIHKPLDRADTFPQKFEDVVGTLTQRAFVGSVWNSEDGVQQDYEDAYIILKVQGKGVRLIELVDSEAVADRVVLPLVEMFDKAVEKQ